MRAPVMKCGRVLKLEWTRREQQRTAAEYARGYLAGWHECYAMCLEEIEEELKCMDALRDFGSLLDEKNSRPRRSN